MKKTSFYFENSITVRTWFKDFKPENITEFITDNRSKLELWKYSIYELYRYQLSFEYAYSINIRETRRSGVYVMLVIKPAFNTSVLGLLETLGFTNIETENTKTAIIDGYELPENVDAIEIEY